MSASKKTRRPALWTALGFGVGIFLGRAVEMGWVVAATLSGLAFLCAVTGFYRKARWAGWMLWVVVILLGALRYHIDTALSPLPHWVALEVFGKRGVVTGRIVQEPERSDERMHFAIELEQVVTDSAIYHLAGQVLVTVKDVYLPADYGDRVSLRGKLQRPRAARNPSGFDYQTFLAQQDIYGTLFVGKPEQVVAVEHLPGHWLYEGVVLPLRRAVRQSIERNLAGAPAGLLLGVLLGEKRRISEEVRGAFRRVGLAHALVVSGLHVGMVGGFFFLGFRLLRLADRPSSAATIAALVLYALATGAQVPVVRAVLMGAVVLLGRVLRRQGDIYNTLGLAALAILVLWPESPWSLSFQLSFGATWAIVALHGPIASLFPAAFQRPDSRIGRWVVSPLCASLAAQLGTGPLIAYSFQQLALTGVVANIVVVPLLALAVGLGLLAALTGWILPWVATAFNAANYLVLVGLLELVSWWAALPFASVAVPRPGVLFVAVAAALCLLGPLLPHKAWAYKAAIFAALVWLNVAVWTYALRSRDLEIVFLDVGQGDAAFVRFPDGKTMVVDGGERSEYFDYGEQVLLPFLRSLGIRRVHVVVASHPHNDHIGGLVALLEDMEVDHFLDSGQVYDSWTARRLQQLIAERGVHYHRVAAGDSLAGLDGVAGLVLHPTPDFVDADGNAPFGPNNGSVVFSLQHGAVRVLFTGDVEQETDPAILAWGARLPARLLKVAHHGSRTSSQPLFVEAVAPAVAVMSLGEGNKFKHPAPEVVERYTAHGAQVLRTDYTGAIRVRTDGTRMVVQTMLE